MHKYLQWKMDGEGDGMAATAKLTALIKEKPLTNFISVWKPLLDFFL